MDKGDVGRAARAMGRQAWRSYRGLAPRVQAAVVAGTIAVLVIAGATSDNAEPTALTAADGRPDETTTTVVSLPQPTTTTTTTAPPTTTTSTTEAPTTTTTVRPKVTTTTTARPRVTTTTARAAASSCHPSYTRTCIPSNVSDADCAGGSGNGPYYVQEKNIGVVGPDEYGLDADGDGVGCESR